MSDFFCDCDGDAADFYRAARYRARKTYSCYECGALIQPGEQYHRAFWTYGADRGMCRTCPRCVAVFDFITASIPCFCWLHGNLLESATECAEHYRHEADGLLFGTLRRIVIARRAAKKSREQR